MRKCGRRNDKNFRCLSTHSLSFPLLDFAPSSESEILAGSLCNWINHKRKELIRLSDNRRPNWLLPLVIEKAGFGQLLSWVVWRFQTACAFRCWDRRTSRSTWHSAAESPSFQPPVSRTPVSGWKVALNINLQYSQLYVHAFRIQLRQ